MTRGIDAEGGEVRKGMGETTRLERGEEGELSAMQNSSTPHLVILWFGRRFFCFFRDNRRFTPDCGFELVKLTMLICVCEMGACGRCCRYSSGMVCVLCPVHITGWRVKLFTVCVNLQQATQSLAFTRVSVSVSKYMKSVNTFKTHNYFHQLAYFHNHRP